MDLGLDLPRLYRETLNTVVPDGRHEVFRTDQSRQLSCVDLRNQDAIVRGEDLAEVAREGVDVAEVCVSDVTTVRIAPYVDPQPRTRRSLPCP